jgi:hypothetical protein
MLIAKEWNVQQSMNSWVRKELVSSDDYEDREKYTSLVDPFVLLFTAGNQCLALQIHRPFFYIIFHFMKINGCRNLMGNKLASLTFPPLYRR